MPEVPSKLRPSIREEGAISAGPRDPYSNAAAKTGSTERSLQSSERTLKVYTYAGTHDVRALILGRTWARIQAFSS